MKNVLWFLVIVITSLSAQDKSLNSSILIQAYNLNHYHIDPTKFQINQYVKSELNIITTFFNKDYKNSVEICVFPYRKSLDKQWQSAWGMPDFTSQCWMVGSGIKSRLNLLSPTAWKTETCEHNSEDSEEIERLVVHELIHILHNDYNRSSGLVNIIKL